jgi:hypothetical protein
VSIAKSDDNNEKVDSDGFVVHQYDEDDIRSEEQRLARVVDKPMTVSSRFQAQNKHHQSSRPGKTGTDRVGGDSRTSRVKEPTIEDGDNILSKLNKLAISSSKPTTTINQEITVTNRNGKLNEKSNEKLDDSVTEALPKRDRKQRTKVSNGNEANVDEDHENPKEPKNGYPVVAKVEEKVVPGTKLVF